MKILDLWREFAGRTGALRRWIPLQLVSMALNGAFQAVMPLLTGILVDRISHGPRGFVDHQLWPAAGALAVACACYMALEYVQKSFASRVGAECVARFRIDLYRHLLTLGDEFYLRHRAGDITARLTRDIDEGAGGIYWSLGQVFWAVAVVGVSGWALCHLAWPLAAAFVALLPVWVVSGRWLMRRARGLERELADEYGALNGRLTENIANHALVRAFAREEDKAQEFIAASAAYRARSLRVRGFTNLAFAGNGTLLMFVIPLLVLDVAAGGGALHLTPGELVAAYGSWMVACVPLEMLTRHLPRLARSFAAMDRVRAFLEQQPTVADRPGARPLEVRGGAIRFAGVRFRYPGADRPTVLDGLDLEITAGRRTALVGPSGCGKTTIASLALRLYDPEAGTVAVDGQDLREVAQGSLRSRIGLVQQETILLSGSIRDNLRLVRSEATDAELERALARAGIWDFVAQTEHGLGTIIGERGVKLSGGQRQRLAIARVFLLDPPVVILDEATSSLDGAAEARIQAALDEALAGRSALVIAHRIATVVRCDRIVYLAGGRVVADGTHEQLLRSCPPYAELCREQGIAGDATPARGSVA
jgi:ABC-type multidrug transport system fused ATPase/permease subunit